MIVQLSQFSIFTFPLSPTFLSLQFTLISIFFSDYRQFCFRTFLSKWDILGPKRTNFIPLQLLKITTPNRKGEFYRSESTPNIISAKVEKENINQISTEAGHASILLVACKIQSLGCFSDFNFCFLLVSGNLINEYLLR